MDLQFVAALVGILALMVSTGIITVGASTLVTNLASKAFERQGETTPVGRAYTLVGGRADRLRNRLTGFPEHMRSWYWLGHTPLVVLLIVIIAFRAIGPFKSSSGIVDFAELGVAVEAAMNHWPQISILFVFGYILFIIRYVLVFLTDLLTVLMD